MTRVIDEPIFVVGSPRSGTTMLRLMLTCHPQVVVPPECGFAVWYADRYSTWTAADVPRFADDVAAARKFDTWGLTRGEVEGWLREHPVTTYADACAEVYFLYAAKAGRTVQRWGDKNNFHVRRVDDLRDLWPRARFVHLVRDGRDVACSYLEVAATDHPSAYRPILPTEPDEIATVWSTDVEQALAALERAAPERVVQLRYEDLVQEPEATLRTVCAGLGLAWSADMLGFHVSNRLGQLEPPAMLSWKQRTLEPASARSVGRHRHDLSRAQRDAFERVAGTTLGRLGYLVEQP